MCKDKRIIQSIVLTAAMAVIQEALVMQVGENSIGNRVRVVASVIVYHHPEHRNEAFDLKGQEGEVIQVIQELRGKPISATLPYVVKFGKKFRSHFHQSELEQI